MAERNPPIFLQGGSHPAALTRLFVERMAPREGVILSDSLQVTERAAGANMSVDVADGHAIIAGDQAAGQGSYYVSNDATVNLAIAAADATNPRIDRVIARVSDVEYDAGASDSWALEVLTGTPASSPSAPVLPDDALDLAEVTVAAGATSITNANITDKRPVAALAGDHVMRRVYLSSGSTFDKADYPWLRKLFVRVQAGGGGGGGCPSTGSGVASVGAPGAAGGYAEKWLRPDEIDDSVAVTVGPGGNGGAAGSNAGNTGGTSSFEGTPTASGGAGGGSFGGTSANRIVGGVEGGSGSNGDVNVKGGGAGPCFRLGGTTAGGGPGGASAFGSGAGASAADGTSATGKNAGNYGGGGTGGASAASSAAAAGGDGGNGIVIIDLYA